MLEYIMLGVSLFSLYFSIFWLNMYYLEKDEFKKKIKIKNLPFISIIVPAYNEEKTISKTIKSVLSAHYPKNKLEIIVVDDGSTDNTLKIAREFKSKLIKIISKKNGGKASALNVGLKYTKGELVGCLDADSTIEKGSIKSIVSKFEEDGVGAVISSIKVRNPKNFLEKLQWFEYLFALLIRKLMSSLNTLYVTPGVLSVYQKNVLIKSGGFDENNITEDLEIAMRLHYLGYKVKTDINSITYTTVPNDLKTFSRQRIRWYRGLLLNTRKYKDMFFNKDYGFMGMFQLPINIITPVVVIVATLIIGHGILSRIYDFILKLTVINMSFANLLPNLSYKEYLLGINYTLVFPSIVLFFFGLYILHEAHKQVDEPLKFPVAMFLSLTIYPIILSIYWIIVIIQEILGVKTKW